MACAHQSTLSCDKLSTCTSLPSSQDAQCLRMMWACPSLVYEVGLPYAQARKYHQLDQSGFACDVRLFAF